MKLTLALIVILSSIFFVYSVNVKKWGTHRAGDKAARKFVNLLAPFNTPLKKTFIFPEVISGKFMKKKI